MGFNPGIVRVLMGLGELGLLSRKVALQGLALLNGVLELLLDLNDPGLVRLAKSLLRGSFLVGFSHSLL